MADGGLHVGVRLAESAEIIVLQQQSCRPVHGLEIQVVVQLKAIGTRKGVLHGVQIIMVGARGGRKAGMQFIIHAFHPVHGNVARKQLVQPVGHLLTVYGHIPVEVGHHHAGMHAGIGSSGPYNFHIASEQRGECLL